ncbi:hypothetical protein SAMN04515647_3358 [Cohaesibacter sp. ES.047]|uniref:DUF6898 family protein n=1 Tax=Cohaesibacter sp. ES.047 TaxID=1798205 RepID=UPI000BB75F76|nr:serine hydroxymethyltransferase [Cohaesibacter sp. ES.047]SNY93085.1 hypothetical protein SAMN04515647_3358 [Cohaesibacter sp. ES.047]
MVSPNAGEIYIEFFVIGPQMKAVAVDAATGVEVTVFGPKTVSRLELQNLAVRKLKMRLKQLGH